PPGGCPWLTEVAQSGPRRRGEPLRLAQVAAPPGGGGHGTEGISLVPPVGGLDGGRERLARAGRGLAGLARVQRGLGQQVEGRRHPELLADRPAELQSLRSPRLRSGALARPGPLRPPPPRRAPRPPP